MTRFEHSNGFSCGDMEDRVEDLEREVARLMAENARLRLDLDRAVTQLSLMAGDA